MKHPYRSPMVGTEREVIKHYGIITPCFDLHPHQVQPSHIVITSPWFETGETHLGNKPSVRKIDLVRRRERVIRMREEGFLFREIGEALGITGDAAGNLYKKWKKVYRCVLV